MLKNHRFKITVIILTVLLIISVYVMTAAVSTAASTPYQMFVNDMPFPGPLERDAEGRFFVPVYIFEHINGATTKSQDNYTNHFNIQRGNKYVAFNLETGKAYNERMEVIDCPAMLIHGHAYVSAYRIAAILDLPVPEWKGGVLRIKDYTARRTMDKMLEIYAPKDVITTTPVPAVTTPPTEPPATTTNRTANFPPENPNTITETTSEIETTTPENTRDINNYLIFDTGNPQNNSDNLEVLINFLDSNKIRAIFFLTYEEITANPGKLREIFASGHDIGIKINRSDYANRNDLINEVDAANAYIYSLVKQKSRIYRITADFEDAEYMKDCMAALKRAGYYPCPNHINLNPEDFADADAAIDFLKHRQINLFAFDLNNLENNYQYLELTAKAVNSKFYINFSHINNANIADLNTIYP